LKKKQLIIGLLFAVSIVVLVWGLNLLKGRNVFDPQNTYFGVFDQVNGLLESNPVYLNGLKIGQVEKIILMEKPERPLLVKIQIDKSINIPANTIMRLFSYDLMGSKAIALDLGDSKFMAKSKDTLTTEIQASLQEEVNKQVAPLKAKTESLLSSIDTLIITIQTVLNEKTRENLQHSFDNIGKAINNLEHTTYTIDTLVMTEQTRLRRIISHVESIVYNIRNSNEKLQNIIHNFSSVSDSLAKSNIARTINNADKALADFSIVMEKINKGEGTVGQLINNDSLYVNLEKSAKSLNALLVDMEKNPNRYVHFSIFGRNSAKKD